MIFRQTRAMAGFLLVLFVFLVIGNVAIISNQRKLLKDRVYTHTLHELELIAATARDAMLKHDYITVEHFITEWASSHQEIVSISATAHNGFALVEFNKNTTTSDKFEISYILKHADKELMTLKVTGDYQPVIKNLKELNMRLIAYSILLTGIMGAVLWLTLRRFALIPMEAEINARERAEHALQSAREDLEDKVSERTHTLRLIVEHIPEGVALLDATDRPVFTNPIGDSYLKAIASVTQEGSIMKIAGSTLNELIVSPPQIMWHEVTAGLPAGIYAVAVRNIIVEDKPAGRVLVMKDITKEREIESRIFTQEKLAAVGQLASGIAHDFNNVLTGVIGYSEMLLTDDTLSEEVRQHVTAIYQSGQRAADLIGQILDFSRKSTSEFKSVELRAVLREFLKFIERIIPEKIHFSIDFEPGEYYIKADVTKLQQVLANLAVNARDAMPEGGRLGFRLSKIKFTKLDVRPFPDMFDGQWVVLTVSDTGTGIPPTVLPHIFEPFYTTKGVGMGTGLGLAQVYGIVSQHGGFIDIKTNYSTTPGEGGTSFIIYMPASLEQADVLQEPPAGRLPKGRGETILIIEDDTIVREFLFSVLSDLHYNVLTASNGGEAKGVFSRHMDDISLCITDIVMPDIDGIILSRQLKQKKSSIKIIAVSGYPLGFPKEDLREAGIVQSIQKPFNTKTIADAVRQALDSA